MIILCDPVDMIAHCTPEYENIESKDGSQEIVTKQLPLPPDSCWSNCTDESSAGNLETVGSQPQDTWILALVKSVPVLVAYRNL